jgi:septum formation protein
MPRKNKGRFLAPKEFRIVLASGSPRRRALLARVIGGRAFEVRRSAVPESRRSGENAVLYCMRIALAKASRVMTFESRSPGDNQRDLVVIAADTVISLRNKVIGQPKSKSDAVRILKLLSGKRHDVVTGLAIVLRRQPAPLSCKKNEFIMTKAVISRVWLRRASDRIIHDYVMTGEPMDKAGAYAIQGKGRRLVKKYSGSYTNIVGLPVKELRVILKRLSNDKIYSGRACSAKAYVSSKLDHYNDHNKIIVQ